MLSKAMETDVQARIEARFADLGPRLKQAARYVLDHPEDVALHSLRSLAARAEVAPATLSRLARAVDCADYEAFRKTFQARLTERSFAARARTLQGAAAGGIVQDQARAMIRNLDRFLAGDAQGAVDAAAEDLLAADSVLVIGMLSSFSLAVYAQYVAGMALPNWSLLRIQGGSLADRLYDLSAGDAVLAFSSAPYARATVLACREARARGARVIAVTDRRSSPLARLADVPLVAGAGSPSFFPSVGAQFAVLEGLLATLLRKAGAPALDKLQAVERKRRAYREFWDDDDEGDSPVN